MKCSKASAGLLTFIINVYLITPQYSGDISLIVGVTLPLE